MISSRVLIERVDAGLAVVRVQGEHDLDTVSRLQEVLDSALGERLSIAIDLSEATFIDSSVLAALIEARRSAGQAGLGFALALPGDAASHGVRRVAEVTGLEIAVTVRSSLEEAVAAARAGVKA